MNEMTIVIANGICVTRMTKISAGSIGARRDHRFRALGAVSLGEVTAGDSVADAA
ncbi:MAG: hypothetical protein L0L36_04465 [Brevibacterium sp.]|nr:hypothetical protein [Brevibacterium sp.]MDN6666104.1 hypothetical protein [Brevibacterium sp.]